MHSLEYMLLVCAERARLADDEPLADDLEALASASSELAGSEVLDEGLRDMLAFFHANYAAIMHSEKARDLYRRIMLARKQMRRYDDLIEGTQQEAERASQQLRDLATEGDKEDDL